MKIKYVGIDTEGKSSELVTDLLKDLITQGIITDSDSQVIGVYDDLIILDDVYPSDGLSNVLLSYPDFKIFAAPDEVNPFHSEEGLTDEEKIGTVVEPSTVEVKDEDPDSLVGINLFPETETVFSEKESGIINENKIDNFSSNDMSKRKNFNELDPNGVSVEGQEAKVTAEQEKDDKEYTPSAGSFSSVDVEPFSQEEIDKANDVEVEMKGNEEIKVFSADEIESLEDVDEKIEGMGAEEIEKISDEMEKEEKTFSEGKKRLFAAKRRIRRVASKRLNRTTFSEDLSEKDKSDIIEDIVAILNDSEEIRDAVAEEIDEISPVVAEPEKEEEKVEEEVKVEAEEPKAEAEPEHKEEPGEEHKEEEVSAFTDDEIAEVEETTDEEKDETVGDEEVEQEVQETEEAEPKYDAERTGDVFCKTFSEDTVANYRHSVLAEMANKMPQRTRRY